MKKQNTAEKQPPQNVKTNEEKWSKPLMKAGWTAFPNVILENQKALGLDALDVNILLHIAKYWWHKDNKPHPSKVTIAAAMDVEPRTVQRHIADMEKASLIRREERRIPGTGSLTNIYHLDGLIEHAAPFAEKNLEVRELREKAEKAKRDRKGKPPLRVVPNKDR